MPSSENFDPGRIRSARDRVYGVRMRLPIHDPMRAVLGDDWETTRWFSSESERDAAYADMQREHEYSRGGDQPTLHYEKIEGPRPKSPQLPKQR